MVKPQELEGDVVPHRLPVLGHGDRELHHVLIHAQSDVTTGSVAMREVAVLMRQDGPKRRLLESVQEPDTHQQDAFGMIQLAFAPRAVLIHRHFGARRNTDIVDGTSAHLGCHFVGDPPKRRRLLAGESAARVFCCNLDKQRLDHFPNRDESAYTQD